MYFNSKIIKIVLFLFIIISLLLVIQTLFSSSSPLVEGFRPDDIIKDLKEVANVANTIKNGITSVSTSVSGGISEIRNATSQIDNQFANLYNKIDRETRSVIENSLTEFTDIIEQETTAFVEDQVGSITQAMENKFSEFGDMIEESTQQMMEEKIATFGNFLKNEVSGMIVKQINSFGDKVTKTINSVKEQFDELEGIVNIISDSLEELGKTIRKETVELVESRINQFTQLITKEFENISNKFVEFGNEIQNIDDRITKFGDFFEEQQNMIVNEVKGLAKEVEETAKKSINEVKGVAEDAQKGVSRLDDLIKSEIKRVEQEVNKNVVGRFENFGQSFVKIMSDSIVKPFQKLFLGLGNVFNQFFGILKEIGNKIVSLPGCVLFYIVDTTYATITSICNAILPSFITNIFGSIYDYIFHPIIHWFLNLFGYYDSQKKCYGFDVNKQVDKITDEFNEIGASFEDSFGKFNLKSLKF